MEDYKKLIALLDGACMFKITDMTEESLYKAELFAQAAEAIEKLVEERDSAVEHLRRIADCLSCKYNRFYKNGDPDTYCVHPHQSKCDGRYWEWRGVQEAEHEIDRRNTNI